MEASPAPVRASGASAARAFASAKMADAQGYFQRVVKQELQVLLARGVKREEAVKMLLRRIVASTDPPEPAAVRGVMRQFQMNHDDAVRALIVKQELGRLKRKGMDSFAAIEELTRKMQRISVPGDGDGDEDSSAPSSSPTSSEIASGNSPSDPGAPVDEDKTPAAANEQSEDSADTTAQEMDTASAEVQARAGTEQKPESEVESRRAAAAGEKDVEKQLNLSSLTLCQRIDKVSISAAASNLDSSEAATASSSADNTEDVTRSPHATSQPTSLNASTPPATHRHGRKRRAPFGLHTHQSASPSEGSISPERHVSLASPFTHDAYPSVKKQKVRDTGDSFLKVISRKSKVSPQPASPAASEGSSVRTSNANKLSSSSPANPDRSSSKNLVKRPRPRSASSGDDSQSESPTLDDDDILLIRHLRHRVKRHKASGNNPSSPSSANSSSFRLQAAAPASP